MLSAQGALKADGPGRVDADAAQGASKPRGRSATTRRCSVATRAAPP